MFCIGIMGGGGACYRITGGGGDLMTCSYLCSGGSFMTNGITIDFCSSYSFDFGIGDISLLVLILKWWRLRT